VNLRRDQVIGVMLVIVIIGLLADKILFSPWERFLHRRWGNRPHVINHKQFLTSLISQEGARPFV
jgi:hypothetical protein